MEHTRPEKPLTVKLLPRTGNIPRPMLQHSKQQDHIQSSKALSTDSKKRQVIVIPTVKRPVMSPETVLRDYKQYLTAYELNEIKNYKQVWCFGTKANKSIYSKVTQSLHIFNSGHDTEEGYYKAAISDHLVYRFEILQVIGHDHSGQILKCVDHKNGVQVAIKVFRSRDSFYSQGQAEVKILEVLRKVDEDNTANIAHMKEHFYFRLHFCITFDDFEKDLSQALLETCQRGFKEGEVRNYAIDVLKCLQVLNEKKIIHGNIKPDKILLYKKDSGKRTAVGDFRGSYFEKQCSGPITQTLSYVSPERLLGKTCSPATDMWSLGCMLAELHIGRRLFRGRDKLEQFNIIMKLLGAPPAELVLNAPERKNFFNNDGIPLKMKEIMRFSTTLAKHLKSEDVYFLDFIACCLEYDPEKRITPEEALLHPWIQEEMTTPVASAGRTSSDTSVPSSQSQPIINTNTKTGGNDEARKILSI